MQSHLVQVSQRLTLHALSTPPLAQSTVPSRAVTVCLSLVSVLSLSATALRTGRNPQTGAEIKIAAKNVVKFKAGAGLKV